MNRADLSLFISRIQGICTEMGTILQQSAISPNIRDRLDFSCAIFDADGQLIAQAAHIPVHLGSMAYAMRDLITTIEWADGDVVLVDMNNPQTVEDEHSWSRVGWNPFRGRDLVGWAQVTVVGGVPVFERTEETGPKGHLLVEAGEVGSPIVMMPWR